jgi:peptidoglycan/LPS O-acetylase OafA/YrhL
VAYSLLVVVRIDPMHLRPPSIDPGITSFVWAFVLGVLLWGFLLAIGISKPASFIIAALAACAIFVYVRLYGEDEPRGGSR